MSFVRSAANWLITAAVSSSTLLLLLVVVWRRRIQNISFRSSMPCNNLGGARRGIACVEVLCCSKWQVASSGTMGYSDFGVLAARLQRGSISDNKNLQRVGSSSSSSSSSSSIVDRHGDLANGLLQLANDLAGAHVRYVRNEREGFLDGASKGD